MIVLGDDVRLQVIGGFRAECFRQQVEFERHQIGALGVAVDVAVRETYFAMKAFLISWKSDS